MACLRALIRKKFIDPKTIADTKLSRCLSVLDLTALGVGSTLGAGVYVVAAEIARDVAGPAAIISFLIAGIASVLSGLCYAEFGARVPKTGSAYVYSYVTIGEIVAFIIGWNLVLEYMIGAAAISRAWSAYFDSVLHDQIRKFITTKIGEINVSGLGNYPDFLALSICLLITLIQLTGVKKSTRFIFLITLVNIGVITVIIGVGATLAQPKNWSNFMPYGTTGVLAGSATAFFAFVGFDVIATTGEEAKNPSKSIPIAIVLSLLICFIAYFGVTAAITLVVPYNELQLGAALPKAFAQRGAYFAQYVIAVGALCGMTAAINGGLFPLPRLLYAMASDGLIFKFFAYISKKTEVPLVGTLFSGALSGILAMLFELQELVEMMSIGTLQAYTIVSTCVLVLRYQPGGIGITLNDEPQDKELEGPAPAPTKEPTEKSGKIARYSIAFLFINFFGLSAFLIHGMVPMFHLKPWAIFVAVFLVITFVVCIILIGIQPRSRIRLPFKVPLVPFLPLASMFINIYLMMELSSVTWIRFCLWMIIGMCIYFFYGIRHSVEGQRQKELGNYIPLQQVDEKDPKETSEEPQPKTDEDKPEAAKEKTSDDKRDEFSTPS
ncbi:cationic amino acid transporter 2-like isoform X3 [Actinia tenebrosa]|uniref:Cationic amino acid transporter 2-like isoform X3 n=1 Tax=Actinia tenebrosa TaxID=6105 RepID=A0A6P8IEM7_ACTTE|nr:cationic amino acid transporter 2-like isoform X3 [Actinia tenebrosa]